MDLNKCFDFVDKLRASHLVSVYVAGFLFTAAFAADVPSLQSTPLEPVLAVAGEEALIDCVVKDQQNYTVLWRRISEGDKGIILTAGNVRVNGDSRFSVLHSKDHDNWVLRIMPARVSDSGRYSCELNTSPHQRITRLLTVVDDSAEKATPNNIPLTHNYTECCMNRGIPPECFGYCTLQGIVTGNHRSPRACLEHIGVLTQCLTDGRNHMPCCIEQRIPETCRSVCVGDYRLSTITEHYQCMDYTMTTLSCIASGIEILPGPPTNLVVEPESPTELLIKWKRPHQNVLVDHFRINVSELVSFDPNRELEPILEVEDDSGKNSTLATIGSKLALSIKVDANQTEFRLKNLKPLTMYEISMISENAHGTSLPTYGVRTLTLDPTAATMKDTNKTEKDLKDLPVPDIRACCIKKEVKQERCLRTMCDPTRTADTTLTDVMICAPWANVTFSCMSDGVDHTSCCKRRGIPENCLDFCSGKVNRIDYRHFKCLEFMPFYGACLLEHYGVLPGNPTDVSVSGMSQDWAVVKWNPPTIRPEAVTKYSLYWRKLDPEATPDDFDPYYALADVRSPYLLDRLEPNSMYEIFIAAENKYGSSDGSARLIFKTLDVPKDIETNETVSGYNETQCCVDAKVDPTCLPLCSYKVRLSDLQTLGPVCVEEMERLVRCGAGGRDHTPCCERFAVNPACISICSGKLVASKYDSVSTLYCAKELGAILTCMEEGKDIIPAAPEEFHVTFMTPTTVHLLWNASSGEANATKYRVYYIEIEGSVPPSPLNYTNSLNVTFTMAIISDLKPNTTYSFYVTAGNEFGWSTPSLIVVTKTPEKGVDSSKVESTLSPPYGLDVFHTTVDRIALKWQPPVHIPLHAEVTYNVYYHAVNGTGDNHPATLTTHYTTLLISNLTYDTQYKISVEARTGDKVSPMSEVVLAWTDAAIPAFVNIPLIIPSAPLREGGNVTLMCIGIGVPTPDVSIYINGQPLVTLPQHHVAVTLQKITRNITQFSCFASNGYGPGAHSSVDVHVLASPIVTVPMETVFSELGATARLTCQVSGFPEPHFLWFRDRQHKNSIRSSDMIGIQALPDPLLPHTYESSLLLRRVTKEDAGTYYCSAKNQFGLASRTMQLDVKDKPQRNTSTCCQEQNVSAACQDVCSIDIDVTLAISKPECIADMDKLMYCASDGSDHRQCCRTRNVPVSCQRWCAGRSVLQPANCALVAAREILSCFEEGRAILPGPPEHVRALQVSSNEIDIMWDPPKKNPHAVQWYKIFWRSVGSLDMNKNETLAPPFKLTNLQENTIYEFIVKAGNVYGMSQNPAIVVHGPQALSARMSQGTKIVLSLCMVALLLIILGILFMYYYYGRLNRRFPSTLSLFRRSPTPPQGVSFENPTYVKEHQNSPPTPMHPIPLTNQNGGAHKVYEDLVDLDTSRRPRAVENCYEDIRTVRLQTTNS